MTPTISAASTLSTDVASSEAVAASPRNNTAHRLAKWAFIVTAVFFGLNLLGMIFGIIVLMAFGMSVGPAW